MKFGPTNADKARAAADFGQWLVDQRDWPHEVAADRATHELQHILNYPPGVDGELGIVLVEDGEVPFNQPDRLLNPEEHLKVLHGPEQPSSMGTESLLSDVDRIKILLNL